MSFRTESRSPRWRARGAERQPCLSVKGGSDGGNQRIMERRREQSDAGRQTVRLKAVGNGDGRQIEQIREVCVMAEPLVESERIGLDLGDAIDRAGGRQQ